MLGSIKPRFCIISRKYCIIMIFRIMENILYSRRKFNSSFFEGIFYDSYSSKRLDSPFQRFISLKTNDGFKFLLDISRLMRSNGRNGFRISRSKSIPISFFFKTFFGFFPELSGSFCRSRKERCVSFIRSDVVIDKLSYINCHVFVVINKIKRLTLKRKESYLPCMSCPTKKYS